MAMTKDSTKDLARVDGVPEGERRDLPQSGHRVIPTPGPWSAGQTGNLRVYGPDNTLHAGALAEVFSRKEGRANANLIAAAPDLLEALKVARRVLEVACGTKAPYIRAAFDVIDPAIAKAEGDL
jgi:hypothetical protein